MIWESVVGARVTATRQNAGTLRMGGPEGGVNVPAGTSAAVVMVVCGSFNCARLSHAAAGNLPASKKTAKSAATEWRIVVVLGTVFITSRNTLAFRRLSGEQESLDELTLAANCHPGESLVPLTLGDLGLAIEPDCQQF
jgi:hypothetical protein